MPHINRPKNIDPLTRIIFLDMDGVMNNYRYFRTAKHKSEKDPICPDAVKELNWIVDTTDAKIVISSTWRMFYNYDAMQNLLDNKGFKGEVIGETPDVYSSHKYNAPRGAEINDWITANIDDSEIHEYRRYVIIDDDSDMLLWQVPHFIHTDFSGGGLTHDIAYRTIRTLLGLENIPEF